MNNSMVLSKKALNDKDDNLRAINHILYKLRDGEMLNGRAYQPAISVDLFMHLTLYTEVSDPIEWHRKGYTIDVDTKTFKACGARYFTSDGKDTYTEVELSTKQFRDLVQYYKINEMDLLAMCQKKLKE